MHANSAIAHTRCPSEPAWKSVNCPTEAVDWPVVACAALADVTACMLAELARLTMLCTKSHAVRSLSRQLVI